MTTLDVLKKLRQIIVGRQGKSVQEFYGMTIAEIRDSVDGFEELNRERFQEYLTGCRIISFWSFKGHAGKKLKRYDQIFELAADVKARRERLKHMKSVEIITNG